MYLARVQVNHEQKTDEEALEQAKMKQQELRTRQDQLKEQRCTVAVCVCVIHVFCFFSKVSTRAEGGETRRVHQVSLLAHTLVCVCLVLNGVCVLYRTNTETLHKMRGDRDKLSSDISQANMKYRELNEALESVNDSLRDASVSRS